MSRRQSRHIKSAHLVPFVSFVLISVRKTSNIIVTIVKLETFFKIVYKDLELKVKKF